MNSKVTIRGNVGTVACLCMLPQNRLAGAVNDVTNSSIKIWDLTSSSNECIATLHSSHHNRSVDIIQSLLLLPNSLLASGSTDCKIRVWNLTTLTCVFVIGSESTMCMAPISVHLFASKGANRIQIWQNILSVDFECIQTISERSPPHFTTLALLPNRALASGSKKNDTAYPINVYELKETAKPSDSITKIRSTHQYYLSTTLPGHRKAITCLRGLQYGRLASASLDLRIKIWDLKSGELLSTLDAFACCLVAMPNSRMASAGGRSVRIWDLSEIGTLGARCAKTLFGHNKAIKSMALLPGCKLATGSWDKTVKIYDQEANTNILTDTDYNFQN
jgi:WD40 repeat protein